METEYKPGDHVFFTHSPDAPTWQHIVFDTTEIIDGSPSDHVEIIRDVIHGSVVHTGYSRFDGAGVHVVDLASKEIAVKRLINVQASADIWARIIDKCLEETKVNGKARYSFTGLARAGIYRLVSFVTFGKILPNRILPDDKSSYCAEFVGESTERTTGWRCKTNNGQTIDNDCITPGYLYLSSDSKFIKKYGVYC